MSIKKIIGWYQIIGGSFGFFVSLLQLTEVNLDSKNNTIFILFIFAYLLVFFSGFLLLKEKQIGYYSSLVSQTIQVINFSMGGLAFAFCSGTYLAIEISLKIKVIFIAIYSKHQLLLGTESEYFVINLIPLLIIIFLLFDIYQKKFFVKKNINY